MIHCGLGRRFVSPQCFRGSHAAALYNTPFTNPVQAVKVGLYLDMYDDHTISRCFVQRPQVDTLQLCSSRTSCGKSPQVAGMVIISLALVLRSARLFVGCARMHSAACLCVHRCCMCGAGMGSEVRDDR